VPFRCEIIGDGDLRAELEAAVETSGCRQIRLLGAQPQEVVRERLRHATLLVLPCRVGGDGNRDALPTVLLEALACGVPAISTPVAGVPEILGAHGEAGVLVPTGDVPALREAVALLLTDDAARADLARRGRARAERLFSRAANVARLRQLLARGCAAEVAADGR
jgi:glycosyltransferase involved in cell wall biosynthesis